MQALLDIVDNHKAGHNAGIYSICSAHPVVIEAALKEARERGETALIEATSNQVNQFGGYTGMKPADFRTYVAGIARTVSFPTERLLLGGDHLGPNCWQTEPAAAAMGRAAEMIAAYVAAGFRKIHLDCSMSCADDPAALADSVIAERAADLCVIAERVWQEAGGAAPLYVIGTEVPKPGGAAEDLDTLAVTTPAAVDMTLEAHRAAFAARGLQAVWPRVVGLVVQPGVEFDHHKVIDYDRAKAQLLSQRIASEPHLVFEAHSTDYQRPAGLRALVEDHFAILKVGPAVTFALRETLWALADIARELHCVEGQTLKEVVLEAMKSSPKYWKSYYTDPARQSVDLQYSLSDRIRYYWAVPQVRQACTRLLTRLTSTPLPLTLLSQYLPAQYSAIREGRVINDARTLLLEGVAQVLRQYAYACKPGTGTSQRGAYGEL
jgi:D-tagatose-1,6-bisphosphate aldolase subunit GatZ/KbaZ